MLFKQRPYSLTLLRTTYQKRNDFSLLLMSILIFFNGCISFDTDSSTIKSVPLNPTWKASSPEVITQFDNGWLKDFNDNNLEKLVKEAIDYNYDLRATIARLEQARYQTMIAGSNRWPQIAGNVGGSRRKVNFIGFPFDGGGSEVVSNRSESFELLLDLSWEIDLWGRLKNRHQAAINDWEATQAELRGALLALAAETARNWFDVIEAKLQVALAEEIVESFSKNTKVIEDRYRRGLSPALDLRLAKSNEASAKATLALRKEEQDRRLRRLEVILGRYPSSDTLEVVDRLPSLSRTIPAGLPSELLERRPDLIAAEKKLKASEQRFLEAKKAFLPSISLTGAAGTESDDLKNFLNNNFSIWTIAGNLVQPIFQGRRILARAKQAREIQIEQLAQYGQKVLQAFQEVETALEAERLLWERKKHLSDAKDEAMVSEKLAWDQYRKGLVNIITLLEAERRAFNARNEYLIVLNQQLQNRITLYLALGGDFEFESK